MIGRVARWLLRDLARECPELVNGALAAAAVVGSIAEEETQQRDDLLELLLAAGSSGHLEWAQDVLEAEARDRSHSIALIQAERQRRNDARERQLAELVSISRAASSEGREPDASQQGEDDSDAFHFGKRALNDRGYACCGKPQGCTIMNQGCAYLQHPYKRWARGEITLVDLEARSGS